jgi:hypothetical protein
MSTLAVATVTTGSGTTDLILSTANASAGDIVVLSGGGLVLAPNASINSIIVSAGSPANVMVTNSTGIYLSSNIASNLVLSSNLTITGLANVANMNVSANVVVTDRITANVFVGSVSSPFNPQITVGVVAGAKAIAPSISTAAAGTLALTANRQYFVPMYIPNIITTATMACEVTTLGTSSSIRMNIYAANASTGAPTGSPLASDVLVSSATIGVKTGAYVVTLKPGLYWASMVCNATAPTIRTMTAPPTIGVSTLGATPMYSYIFGTFTFAAMGVYSGVTSITGAAAATQTPLIAIY